MSFDHRTDDHRTHLLSSHCSAATVTADSHTLTGGHGGVERQEGKENGEVKGQSAPQVKRMNLQDFVFIKVLGKGSFGKVSGVFNHIKSKF